jgi:c-di-AMP phosphodiesterase-like protein
MIIILAVVLTILIAVLIIIFIEDAQMKEFEKEQALEDSIKQLWYDALQEQADGETRFKLSDTTPFEWDEVYIGSGYYEKERLVNLLDQKSNEVFSEIEDKKPVLLGTDLYTTWYFFLEDKLVFELGTFDIFSPGERVENLREDDAWVTAKEYKNSEVIYVDVCN